VKRLGLGVSKVDWTTTFDFVVKQSTQQSARAAARLVQGEERIPDSAKRLRRGGRRSRLRKDELYCHVEGDLP